MSEDNIRKSLADGEAIIHNDPISDGNLVLTTKRLFIYDAHGVFNRDYVIKKEVELKDIVDVSREIGKINALGVIGDSWLIVKPKVGEEWRCQFSSSSKECCSFNAAQAMSITKVNNWVNAIKSELLKQAK